MTAADFVDAMAELPVRLTEVFAKWETIDDELRESYVEDVRWIIRVTQEKLEDEPASSALWFRYHQARAELLGIRDEIQRYMGVNLGEEFT